MNSIELIKQRLQKAPNVLSPLVEELEGLLAKRARATQQHLMVGLFGGTGVGKSTLVNALIGNEVARTSVLRPTSTQIAVYAAIGADLEASLRLRFGEHFSYQEVESDFSGLVLVDTPDLDSVATAHAELAMTWLPALDLALFVTSPERYLDLKPMKALQAQAKATPLAMVLNKSDLVEAETIKSWETALVTEGFDQLPHFMQSAGRGDVAAIKLHLSQLGLEGGQELLALRDRQLRQSLLETLQRSDLLAQLEVRRRQQIEDLRTIWSAESELAISAERFCYELATAAPKDAAPFWWRWLRPLSPMTVEPDAQKLRNLSIQINKLSRDVVADSAHWSELSMQELEQLVVSQNPVAKDRLRGSLAMVASRLSLFAGLGLAGWTIWRLSRSTMGGTPLGVAGISDALVLIALVLVLGRALYWACLPTPYTVQCNLQRQVMARVFDHALAKIDRFESDWARLSVEAKQWVGDEINHFEIGLRNA